MASSSSSSSLPLPSSEQYTHEVAPERHQAKQSKASRSNMASSSSPSSLPLQYTYEVFLSFRGVDTRYTFTDHLHRALIGRGIRTFRDDEELNRGEDISQELLKAIEESRVSIIVFSPNYASSRWCLDELVHILECRRSRGQAVKSVFYKVDPSDVRKQTGAFGEAFAKLDQCKYENKICKWRTALKEAADLSGWPVKDDEYEAKFIDDIVDELSARVVNPSCMLHVAAHPVGIESCREDVNRLLDLEENVVRMVGIWGAGGIGKTTIAKDVFNSIRHKFEGSCFLADVRSKSNGLPKLQQTLLSSILGDSKLEVNSVDEGVGFIETRMRSKKVLIILDDVSHSSHLEKLVPSHNCFGRGSRILITTRDRGCLRKADAEYEVKILDDYHAMKLFSMAAFREMEPPSDYLELAQGAIRYAQGLPLALTVLGSHLIGRSREEWEDTIASRRGNPHVEVRDVLRLSYDTLREDLKEAFLDIVCFFKGMRVDDVKPILQACYGLNSGIKQLQQKALLRIDKDGWNMDTIWMHDLIEEMGIQIANPKAGESTRLWEFDDVERALTDDHTETEKIKGIQIESIYQGGRICLNAKSFSKMKNLRYFLINGYIEWSGNINHLPNELKYFYWKFYPLRSFPINFHLRKLVRLEISHATQITRLWEGRKNLPNLKYMDLSYCYFLEELPDLGGIPNLIELRLGGCERLVEIPHSIGSLEKLEILDLGHCKGLVEIPHSIGSLEKLEILNLGDCKGLVEIPHSIGSLEKLEILDLGGCKRLQEFPKFIGKLDSLRELNLSYTDYNWGKRKGTKQVWVECCQNLTNLEILDLRRCPQLVRLLREAIISPDHDSGSLVRFPKLRTLDISLCYLSTADFIGDLDCLETLNNLRLSYHPFVTLPALSKFVNLESLSLSSCDFLREIPELPPNILQVDASYCRLLERFSNLPKYSSNTVQMNLEDCHRFSECLGDDMKMMENILLNNQNSRFSLVFPSLGSEVPKWFQYCSKDVIATEKGWSITSTCAVCFEIPSKLELDNIAGVAICSVISAQFISTYSGYRIGLRAYLSINGVHIHQYSHIMDPQRHIWVSYTPLSGDIKGKLLGQGPYKCRVEFHCPTSCGVHLVCQPPYENSNKMVMADEPAGESDMHTIMMSPYHHQLEQQDQPILMSPYHHQLEQQDQPIVMSPYHHQQEQQDQPKEMSPAKRHFYSLLRVLCICIPPIKSSRRKC